MDGLRGRCDLDACRVCIIAHEFPPFPGGIATYAWEMAAALDRWGVRVEIIAPLYPQVGEASRDGPAIRRILRHHRLAVLPLIRVLWCRPRLSDIRLVHAVDTRSALLACLLRRLGGPSYAITVHGSELTKLSKQGIVQYLLRRVFQSATVVFANSAATRQLFLANVGDRVPVRVTHLGVDERWFRPAAKSFENPMLAQLEGTAHIVSSVGRLEDRKGHLLALQALETVAAWGAFDDLVYVVAGPQVDRSYADRLAQAAESSRIRCVLTGALSESDVLLLFRRSLCHLLTAVPVAGKIEGFGLVVLEAAAQGCPTVATRVGGIPEVIEDGQTGFLLDQGDVDGIAAVVGRLLRDPNLRSNVANKAMAHAKRFTWDACARQTYAGFLDELRDVPQP